MAVAKPPQDHLVVAILKLFESESNRMWIFGIGCFTTVVLTGLACWFGSRGWAGAFALGSPTAAIWSYFKLKKGDEPKRP